MFQTLVNCFLRPCIGFKYFVPCIHTSLAIEELFLISTQAGLGIRTMTEQVMQSSLRIVILSLQSKVVSLERDQQQFALRAPSGTVSEHMHLFIPVSIMTAACANQNPTLWGIIYWLQGS